MANRVVLRPDLDAVVARQIAAPAVTELLDRVRAEAAAAAPDGKAWQTAGDERVRPSHEAADGQEVPANLRYQLPRAGHTTLGAGVDLAREPRDPSLPAEQERNCRCASAPLPGAVGRTMHATPVTVDGARASGRVTGTYPRIGESEYPDSGDSGGGWARAALRTVAAETR